jgi:hypothetical protein
MSEENVQSIVLFREAVAEGASLDISSDGRWARRWKIQEVAGRLFGTSFDDPQTIARYFETYLKSLEVSSEQFKTSLSKNASYEEIARAAAAVLARLAPYLDPDHRIANYKISKQALAERLKTLKETPITVFHDENEKQREIDAVRMQIRALNDAICAIRKQSFAWACHYSIKREMIALKYRTLRQKEIHAASQREQFERDKAWLCRELLAWKARKREETKLSLLASELTRDDLFRIAETCRYPDMVRLLRQDPTSREEYFHFVFQDTKDSLVPAVHIAVQFPQIQNRITNSFLGRRAARLNNNGIIFKEAPDGTKDVLLKVDGHYESLRDDTKKITFRDTSAFTIAEILKSFSSKPSDLGELEYFQDGVLRSLPKDPPFDLSKKDWYLNLPVFERLTLSQVVARYGARPQNGQGLVAIKASREHPEPNRVDDTHGWLVVILPTQDGTYLVQPWGRYSRHYPEDMSNSPTGIINRFLYSFKTVAGLIAYGDESEFFSHRESISCPAILTPAQIVRLFEKIASDIERARDGSFVFQAQGENCITWCLETLEYTYDKKLPDVFSIDASDFDAPGAAKYVSILLHTLAKKTCSLISNIVRVFLSVIGGATQPYIYYENGVRREKSLLDNPYFLQGKFHIPSMLFDRPRWERLHQALLAASA